jgi:Protein of unknown function (DUF2752)
VALTETTAVDLRPARLLAGAMLAVAAVRPLLPVETVPPCPLRALTGVPCPLCGMTRGVTAAVHGHLGHAIALNPASIVAVVLALVLLFVPRLPKAIVVPVWTIVAVLGAMWTYQLFKYSTGRPL